MPGLNALHFWAVSVHRSDPIGGIELVSAWDQPLVEGRHGLRGTEDEDTRSHNHLSVA